LEIAAIAYDDGPISDLEKDSRLDPDNRA